MWCSSGGSHASGPGRGAWRMGSEGWTMDDQLMPSPSSAVVGSSATTTASRPSKRGGGEGRGGLVWGKQSMPLWPERQLFSRFEFPSFHGTVFRFQSQARRSQGGRSAGAGSLEGGREGRRWSSGCWDGGRLHDNQWASQFKLMTFTDHRREAEPIWPRRVVRPAFRFFSGRVFGAGGPSSVEARARLPWLAGDGSWGGARRRGVISINRIQHSGGSCLCSNRAPRRANHPRVIGSVDESWACRRGRRPFSSQARSGPGAYR